MSAIDRVKQHYHDLGSKQLSVPEWGEPDAPLVIYWTPLTAQEHRKITGANDGLSARLFVSAVILKAQDRAGKPLFDEGDRPALMGQADVHVLRRIAMAIIGDASVEDTEKN
ncbi:hypothetical protein C3941_23815 [Kaistia algarum]|uniref:hypothetical protein n=1 Tax=Kaistia algarum TaxID=2083279 RepID=UPI000CE842E8|nr:hypothetical protein [Kaistia algarum]MCX5513420.1 hypothetical protein [Kaistia algarum]PPE77426.1 hypothetical protein C3941_23815 [Kaistia algarum]